MEQVNFGKSDMKVSRVGLGLAALGRPGYINISHGEDLQTIDEQQMRDRTHQLLSKAVEMGITYIDAARSYGKAEEFLGSWLQQSPFARAMKVASKWGYYYTADWQVKADKHEIKDHSLALLEKQWEESTNLLKPSLKVYQIHSATFESGVLENRQVLEKLEFIRHKGYVIGLTLSGTEQAEVLRDAMKISVGFNPLFGAVQATYNLMERSAGPALKKAHDNGLAVIVKEALANGRLTDRGTSGYLPMLRSIADKHETTVDAIALGFVLQEPFVTTVLSGAVTVDQLRSNTRSTKVELDMADFMALGQLEMDPARYWKERAEMDWN